MRSDKTVKRDAFSRSFRSSGILMISLSAVAVAYAQSIAYRAPNLTAAVSDITFRGKLSADGKSIAGTWTQANQSFPVSFALATPETLWTYSGASTMPTMSATTDPSFEVATIKPSAHDANWGYSWQTRVFQARG